MNSTQLEAIKLLKKEATSGIVSASICVLLGMSLNIAIPFIFNSEKLVDKIANGVNFTASFGLMSYSLFKTISLKSTIGKLEMFRQLENELLANEQILANQYQLALQQQQYEQQIQSLIPQQITATIPCADECANPFTDTCASTQNGTNLAPQGCASTAQHSTDTCASTSANAINCPYCGSSNIKKNGQSSGKQRYYCNECDAGFTE